MSVRLYTTTSCSWCSVIKKYLRGRGVKFTEYPVDRDPQKFDEMVRKSGQMGVPVLDMGGKVIVGFKKDEIDRQWTKIKALAP